MRDVVVTLGAHGSMVIQGGAENLPVLTPNPAVPIHAVDTTGCGDAFTGALADSLARGEGLVAAARRAAVVASVAAATEGAKDSHPHHDRGQSARLNCPAHVNSRRVPSCELALCRGWRARRSMGRRSPYRE